MQQHLDGTGGSLRVALFDVDRDTGSHRPPMSLQPGETSPVDARFVVNNVGTTGEALKVILTARGHLRDLDVSVRKDEKDGRLASLRGLDLAGVDARGCDFTRRNFRDVPSLRQVDMRHACLNEVNMIGKDATGGRFDRVIATAGKFTNALLVGSSWVEAKVARSDLSTSVWSHDVDLDDQALIDDLGVAVRTLPKGDPLSGSGLSMNVVKGAERGAADVQLSGSERSSSRMKTSFGILSTLGTMATMEQVMASGIVDTAQGIYTTLSSFAGSAASLVTSGMDLKVGATVVATAAVGAMLGKAIVMPIIKKRASDAVDKKVTPWIDQAMGFDAKATAAMQRWVTTAKHSHAVMTLDGSLATRLKRSMDQVRADLDPSAWPSGSGEMFTIGSVRVINCTEEHLRAALYALRQAADRDPDFRDLTLVMPPNGQGQGRVLSISTAGATLSTYQVMDGTIDMKEIEIARHGYPNQIWNASHPGSRPSSRGVEDLMGVFMQSLENTISQKAALSAVGTVAGARALQFDINTHFAQTMGERIVIRRKLDGVVDNGRDFAIATLVPGGGVKLTQVLDGRRVSGQQVDPEKDWPNLPAPTPDPLAVPAGGRPR